MQQNLGSRRPSADRGKLFSSETVSRRIGPARALMTTAFLGRHASQTAIIGAAGFSESEPGAPVEPLAEFRLAQLVTSHDAAHAIK
jgi:hypothetical protein